MKYLYSVILSVAFLYTATAQESAPAGIRPVGLLPTATPAETILSIGKSLMGKPYVPHTLDRQSTGVAEEEQLVVNFQEFDCTTYLETVLALTLAAHESGGKPATETAFRKHLTQLRYRNGVVEGYASRLHYFSDWLRDNERRGLIADVTHEIGGVPVSKAVNYMTACVWKYPHLTDPAVYKQIASVEQDVSRQPFYFVPKAKISAVEKSLKDGDIIMLTAARPGLDMKHVGFAVWQTAPDGTRRVYLLHASSDHGEVVMTEHPLADYVLWNKRLSGIRVARLKTPPQPLVVRATR